MKKSFLAICLIAVNLCIMPTFAQETDSQGANEIPDLRTSDEISEMLDAGGFADAQESGEIGEMQAANELSDSQSENGTDEQQQNSQMADEMAEKISDAQELPPFQVFPTRFARADSAAAFFRQWRPSFALAPTFIPNNAPVQTGMPFAFTVPLSVGLFWRNNFFISVEPNLSFSMSYYLWDNDSGTVFFAEAENRTALALSFLVELPLVFSVNVSRGSSIKLSAGVLADLRFAFLAMGIDENESGTSGTVKTDVQKINEWFWKDAHFMNFGLTFAWMFKVGDAENPTEVGPVVKLRLSMSNSTPNPFMISVGLKVIL